ncbi:MAG: (Fe-S)-binding protein [Bacteroidota bacterium]
MKYDPFILPFITGMAFVLMVVFGKWIRWFRGLPDSDRKLFLKGLFSRKFIYASREVVSESLLHRKVFRANFWLGYMHMSLAFGWFLLIVAGNLETRWYSHGTMNPPWYPIFFEFFVHDLKELPYRRFFVFAMDFLLLLVLSGLFIAIYKRYNSSIVGMKMTTRQNTIDKLALSSLWMVFPLRLLAESFNAGMYDTGGFLTNTLGHFFARFLPLELLRYPTWLAYSIALGTFFVSMPFTRYMHILTEIFLIFLRKSGVREKQAHSTYTDVELNACSRCGLCIDQCQLGSDLEISNIQPAYFLRDLRDGKPDRYKTDTCLICGRCNISCPVGIENTTIRLNERSRNQVFSANAYDYIRRQEVKAAKVAFFAGCMGHLNPSTTRSMLAIFEKAGVEISFIDEYGSICCGRPLKLSGNYRGAEALASKNRELVRESRAEILVTTCPICYKMFRDDYRLEIPVYHHSEYLLKLVEEKKIQPGFSPAKVVFHDPCELGRGCGIFDQPRRLIARSYSLVEAGDERRHSLCCGGSLGIAELSAEKRKVITQATLTSLTIHQPDIIATACPLCKKTFAAQSVMRVADIAELLLETLNHRPPVQIPVSSGKKMLQTALVSVTEQDFNGIS